MLESLALSEVSMRTSFDWAGANYPCTGGPEFGGKRIADGGWRMQAKVRLKVRCEVFPSGLDMPQEKQTIQYRRNYSADPVTYRIDAITNFYGAILELECNGEHEGA